MSIETQLAIKRNAEELSSYLKDLNSWSNEIKKKDVLAKKTKVKKHNYPPIRNSGRIDADSPPSSRPSSPMPEEKSTAINVKEIKKERIKSYDYRSWDKYNVEEELERIENEDYKEPKPMVEEKEEEKDLNQEAIELSLIEKEKGNIMFKKGNYKRAIQYYTKSKELDPTNPVFPLNRAMAYLKLKKYSEAENDCTDCISLSPKNVKALYRRGLARVGLKKYLEAKSDFEAAVVLDPSNKQAKTELNKVIAILKPKQKEEPKPASPVNNKTNLTTTSSKSNQLKKKKSVITKEQEEKLKNKPIRRRLQITEVGRSQEEIQKEKDEELYKKIEDDINEINELIKSSGSLDEKNETISITKNNSEESITPLDMVPVSTTKKIENNKKQPKKMKIIEKDEGEINEVTFDAPKNQEINKEKEEIIQKVETSSTNMKSKTNTSNELLDSNKSSHLSSFILNKEEKKEKQPDEEGISSQKKSKLNSKRSIVIKEVDEIIGETEPLKSINEISDHKNEETKPKIEIVEEVKDEVIAESKPRIEIFEEVKEEEEKSQPKIEIIEEIKEEKSQPKIEIIEEIKEEKSQPKIEIIEEIKEEKSQPKIEIIEEKEDNAKITEIKEDPIKEEIVESPPKKIRPKVKVATTMYDFERDWKSMRNDDLKTFEYLSSIIPENLPSLFKNSLESDYLTRILIIMKKFYIEESMYDEMYSLLDSIQKVNRFEMTLMFMSRKDKQVLKEIFDSMKSNQASSNYTNSNLENLAKKYKITL